MAPSTHAEHPPYALGMTSLALGSVGLLLFFLPILGLPLSLAGLVFGLLGVLVALINGRSSLRWSVLGVALCLLAGVASTAIHFAPAGYIERLETPEMWQTSRERPYVPPPEPPNG